MSSAVLDLENLFRRLKRLYEAWKHRKTECGEPFPKVDSICTAVGSDDNVLYCKSHSLLIWLLGYEISDVIMVFCKDSIHFLASKKKIEFLRQVEQFKDKNSIPPIKLHVRNKAGPEKENFEKLVTALKASGKGKTLGIFVKDEFPGPFVESWKKALKEHSFENVDISNALASLLSVKEESELALVKKACQVTVGVYHEYLRDQIMDIIDSDKKVKHLKLADGVENAMTARKYVSANVDMSQLTTCYPPIVQSGGNYSLKFSAQSDQKNLHFGVIICSLGARYKMYCSNIIRTLLVNPNDSVQENYNFLVDLQEHLIKMLKSGTRLCDVYNSGIDFAREKKPALVDNLTKNFGFVTGIEFRENSLSITSKTTACARKSQVYNLCVGLSSLVNKDADSKETKNYALFLGDTVVVNEEGSATVLTNSKKRIKNVGIFLQRSDDEEVESEKENEPRHERQIFLRSRQTVALESASRNPSNEEQRTQHQTDLAVKLHTEARKRLCQRSSETQSKRAKKSIISYENHNQMPVNTDVKQLKLFVDEKKNTVILPIFGLPVPFHISTIKNISQSVEGDFTYLRINFYHPGATVSKGEGPQSANPKATFAKEVTYRGTNICEPGGTSAPSSNLTNAFRSIKESQKKFKSREIEEKVKQDLVKQDSLIISTAKANPKLKDLYVRPAIVEKKKTTGTLEAHTNGFRYTSINGYKIDILSNNIKNAFFQPCDGEMIISLHFHLKNEIMIGKKKHINVQFYTEVGEMATDLGKNQRMNDRDDLRAEQAERELRHKLKTAFKNFCEKVQTSTKSEISFHTPLREIGFDGKPYKGMVFLQPTTDHCLVNLTEWPPFVISLEDVELVHFEGVHFHSKNCDMVFVFKDYHRKVVKIEALETKKLDDVKTWLNQNDIKFWENVKPLDWPNILKTIINDPEGFFETGGWSFLDKDDESSDEEEAYEPSDVESHYDESDDDSECSAASNVSDSKEDDLDESESEESGKDWSDLECEAEADDRQRETGFEDEVSGSKNRGGHCRSFHSLNKKRRT